MSAGGVDVHAHYVAPEVLDAFREPGAERLGVVVRGAPDGRELLEIGGTLTNQPLLPALSHERERLTWMDEHRIDVQLVSPWMQIHGYELDPSQGRDLARVQNDSIAELVHRNQGRLVGAATVPMQDPVGAALEVRRAVEDLGFHAIQIGTHVGDVNVADPSLDPLWREVADLDVLVLLHPLTVPEAARLRQYVLDWLVGFPAETTHAAAAMLLGGLFERHPNLKVSLPHGGGFLPYQLGRIDRGYEVLGDRSPATHRPSAMVARFLFDTILHDATSLEFLVGLVGAERVVLGSDFPFNLGENDPLGRLEEVAGLAEGELEAIARRNASAALCLHEGGGPHDR